MEGNEIEKAANEHIFGSAARAVSRPSFIAGANWQKERENTELTRANARIEELQKENEALRQKCKLYYHFRGKPLD